MKRYIIPHTLLFVGLFSCQIQAQTDDEKKQTTLKVPKLIHMIDQMYVESVDEEELEINILKGMHNGLSPYSAYQKTELISTFFPTHTSNYQSLGIQFKFKHDTLLVMDVLPKSGAENAGIQKDDKIYGIDSIDFAGMYYYVDLARELLGTSGTTCTIEYVRDGEKMTTSIERKEIPGYQLAVIGDKELNGAINSYEKALLYFDAIYPDSVSNGLITEYGIRYMLEQLDPHSGYISLEDLHDMEAPLKGSFSGVGVRFQINKDTILVAEAIPTGPSEKVGIRAGDKFIYIDDELVAGTGIKNSGVRKRLLGEKGTKVSVKMQRKGVEELLDFTIERGKIPIHSLDAHYMVTPSIGYVKLNNFSATSVEEVRDAISALKRDGMKDLIFDLQNNGGGYLRTAVNLCDELLDGKKLVVYTEGRSYPKEEYNTRYTGLMEEGRVVVLVNESSASASEIVSGAVQDWDRGLIVGRRTFSKGLVQKPVSLPDGTTVRITTSRYYTPSGRCIQKSYDEGSLAYRKEKYDRYSNGESFHKDSIKVDESLQYTTKVKERTVYGGGGIIPDVFVPLDTTGSSGYFSKLMRKGIFNSFTLDYVNDNREKLQEKYPTFEKYKENFKIEKVAKSLFDAGEKEGIEFDKEGYEKAEMAIHTRIKANIAQYLYGPGTFYEIINDLNETLHTAIKVLEDGGEFDKIAQE